MKKNCFFSKLVQFHQIRFALRLLKDQREFHLWSSISLNWINLNRRIWRWGQMTKSSVFVNDKFQLIHRLIDRFRREYSSMLFGLLEKESMKFHWSKKEFSFGVLLTNNREETRQLNDRRVKTMKEKNLPSVEIIRLSTEIIPKENSSLYSHFFSRFSHSIWSKKKSSC